MPNLLAEAHRPLQPPSLPHPKSNAASHHQGCAQRPVTPPAQIDLRSVRRKSSDEKWASSLEVFHKTTIRQLKSLGKSHKTTIRQLHKTTQIPWEFVQIVAFVDKRKIREKLIIFLCETPLSGGPFFVRIPKESELSYGVVL